MAFNFFGRKNSTTGIFDTSTGTIEAQAGDNGGREALVSDDTISQILLELRLMNLLLAQRFGVTEDLAILRNDPNLSF